MATCPLRSSSPKNPHEPLPQPIPSRPPPKPNLQFPTPPTPPPPEPPPPASSTSPSTAVNNEKSWSSLFKHLPRNARSYTPVHFDIVYEGKPLQPPPEVIKAGTAFWSSHLVGFFLEERLSYTAVVEHLKRIWTLKGNISIKCDRTNFYFLFSDDRDRQQTLGMGPIFIKGRMFLISTCNPSLGLVQKQIQRVPVWIYFYDIPLTTWTLLGVNWLACHIGRLKCFDQSTEKLERFAYAKCLVEITPDRELPDTLLVGGEGNPAVRVEYGWRPLICTKCSCFGHKTIECMADKISVEPLPNNKVNESSSYNETAPHSKQAYVNPKSKETLDMTKGKASHRSSKTMKLQKVKFNIWRKNGMPVAQAAGSKDVSNTTCVMNGPQNETPGVNANVATKDQTNHNTIDCEAGKKTDLATIHEGTNKDQSHDNNSSLVDPLPMSNCFQLLSDEIDAFESNLASLPTRTPAPHAKPSEHPTLSQQDTPCSNVVSLLGEASDVHVDDNVPSFPSDQGLFEEHDTLLMENPVHDQCEPLPSATPKETETTPTLVDRATVQKPDRQDNHVNPEQEASSKSPYEHIKLPGHLSQLLANVQTNNEHTAAPEPVLKKKTDEEIEEEEKKSKESHMNIVKKVYPGMTMMKGLIIPWTLSPPFSGTRAKI